MLIEYRTTIQPLFRHATSEHFANHDGIYHAPTAPLAPPPITAEWSLHSVQAWGLGIGEPKLLVVWMREVKAGEEGPLSLPRDPDRFPSESGRP